MLVSSHNSGAALADSQRARLASPVGQDGGLARQSEMWREVNDFNWHRAQHSPNWAILEGSEEGSGKDAAGEGVLGLASSEAGAAEGAAEGASAVVLRGEGAPGVCKEEGASSLVVGAFHFFGSPDCGISLLGEARFSSAQGAGAQTKAE